MIAEILGRLLRWRPATKRDRSIALSMLTSTGSKAISLLAQVIAYPIAVRSLERETFSSFVMLSSVLAWFSLSSVGIGPSLTRMISRSAISARRDQETVVFSTAMWLAVGIASLFLGVLALVMLTGIVQPARLLGVSVADSDATLAIMVAGVLASIGVVTSVTEGARSGYLEQFATNFWNGFGSALSLLTMLAVAWLEPTLTAMCLAVYGTTALARITNTFTLTGIQRRYLFPLPRYFHWPTAISLVTSSIAFLIVQLNTLFVIEAPTLILGWMHSAAEATPFNVIMRLEFLLTTGLTMISVPLWPAISDAHVRGEHNWIRHATRRFFVFTLLYSTVIGTAIAFFGSNIVHLWLGRPMDISQGLQVAMGIFFPIWLLQHAVYTVLVGLGKVWHAALSLCVWSGFLLVLSVPLTSSFGRVGMAAALNISALICLPMLGHFLRRALDSVAKAKAGFSSTSSSEAI